MKWVGLVGFILFSSLTYSQDIIPGLIPRFYSIEAATDLALSPEQAHEAALQGSDLSLLDPDTTTNIWHPSFRDIDETKLATANEKMKFIRELPSRSGQLRFSVMNESGEELVVVLSKKIHNFLLRKNLLNKIGYVTPAMSWLSKFKLSFDSTIDRDLFLQEMKDQLMAGTERWVVESHDLEMTLQDAIVLSPDSEIYNLTLGVMPAEIHQGRRLLRAPYIALALVDTPESVNLMPWQAGRVVLNQIKLYHNIDLENSYQTSFEDARWIGRRIAHLSREDWEDIVKKAHYPTAVEKILIEKIIARRNDLLDLLNLKTEFFPLSINPAINYAEDLVQGEIIKEFFPGHASRFSYGDPESPFSASELGSFALSRFQSQVLDTAISQLNKKLGTPDQKLYENAVMNIIKNEGVYFPTQAVAIPTFHGGIILSRDIVTGSYMGTNNRVQLVDNFGFSLDAGVMIGVENIQLPMTLGGGASLAFQRVFSHIKPLQSLKKSLKEPYRNLLVPFVFKKLAHKIDELDAVTNENQESKLAEIVSELKESLQVGESFIITDSLVPNFAVEMQLSLSRLMSLDQNLLKLYASFQVQRLMLSRFHLYRADENTIHLYQDYGKNWKLMLTLKLKSYVPIAAFNVRYTKASAETHMYKISLRPRDGSIQILKALRASMLSLNHSALREMIKPHRLEHHVKEVGNTFQFLIFKRNQVAALQEFTAHHAQGGEEKKIYRRYDAVTGGTDIENYAVETLNDLVKGFLKFDANLSAVPTVNPGFTLGGKARNKIFTSEFDGQRVSTSYARIFNGWRVRPKKLKKFVNLLNAEVGEILFPELSYQFTDSILLYQLQVQLQIAQEGTFRLLHLPKPSLRYLFHHHSQGSFDQEMRENLINGLHAEAQEVRDWLKEDPKRGMKKYHKWLRSFLDFITIKGLAEGAGKENVSYQGRMDGFREGDENGDQPLFSHVYGELPVPMQLTPSQRIMQNWGILEGELFINWMTERAI